MIGSLVVMTLVACGGLAVGASGTPAPQAAPSRVTSTSSSAPSHPGFTDAFPPEEFAARRAEVMRRIGDGIAIVQGAAEKPAEAPFRQNNQFFYLTGVEVPRALLIIDGRAKRAIVYLPDHQRLATMWGGLLRPDAEATRVTGLDAVLPRDQLAADLPALAATGGSGAATDASHGARRVAYVPFRPEVLGSGSAGDAVASARATASDPWDGRPSREQAFIDKIKAAAPTLDIRDLDPLLDDLRFIKSAREIDMIRQATRITEAGILAAMREAAPGKHEYDLQAAAEYVFKQHGAQGAAYFALVATGTNTIYSHYHRNTAVLADGDLVQFDYAPDYHYYVSDVTRVFPANGRFTPWQREYYTIYLRLYQALMTSITPRVSVSTIIAAAVARMDAAIATTSFTDSRIKTAATRFVDRYRTSTARALGHTVGMEVHDVTRRIDTLEPGQVFTIEPAMPIPELGIGIRLEDVILMTETGYENLSASLPVEIDAIERIMAQPGTAGPAAPGLARRTP